MLRLLCDSTGMRFAAVARVTAGTWTVCAVEDRAGFGLAPGSQLPLDTVLCRESRAMSAPIVIDRVSRDPVYRNHCGPPVYGIESYITVPIVRPDGHYFGNLCAVDRMPVRVSDARTVGLFASLARMIALQLDNDDELARADAEVLAQREAAELREQFIAVLGHDLRNPLAAIAFAAETLVMRPDAQDKKLGERLRLSIQRMRGLIDNVMDLARVRLGSGIGLEIRSAELLAAQLAAVVEEARGAHPGMTIHERIAIDRPVACDPARIQQLVSNLLGNASHHGDLRQPVVFEAGVTDDWLELSVLNRGDRIAEADLPKIFQPYWRPASSKPAGGLGLGLYICSEIVKAHGGRFGVTSNEAEGTKFTALIPVGGSRGPNAGSPPRHGSA